MSKDELQLDGDVAPTLYPEGGTNFVVRVSRTASGVLTYTVGASMGQDADVAGVVAKVMALNDALTVVFDHENKDASTPDAPLSLSGQLRHSILVQRIKAITQDGAHADGWVETPMLVAVGESRNRVTADLKALVEAGVLEYRQGTGRGHPSKYRLVESGKAVA